MAPVGNELRERANLRDLGGMPAAGGTMRVRSGQVYRAAMPNTSDEDISAALRTLGLASVVDLRAEDERSHVPAAWQALGCEDYICHEGGSSAGDLGRTWEETMASDAATMRNVMLKVYRNLPISHGEAYRRLFERLAQGRTPLLFHCTAGKDRTGVAAALILGALNVPREAIFADYLATNAFDKRHIRWSSNAAALRGAVNGELDAARRDAMAPILAADTVYLEATFTRIDADHGSVPAYLQAVLGIDATQLERIRTNLLEPAG